MAQIDKSLSEMKNLDSKKFYVIFSKGDPIPISVMLIARAFFGDFELARNTEKKNMKKYFFPK